MAMTKLDHIILAVNDAAASLEFYTQILGLRAEPYSVQSSHGYIASVVPTIVRDGLGRTGAKPGWLMDAVRRYARRVELLHPQIDNAGSMPANCEYPWAGPRGEVLVPAEYDFALDVHAEKAAVTMIKEVRARAMELAV